MNGSRFDALTRWAGRPTTRRAALGSVGAGLATFAVGRVSAQDASPVAVPEAPPVASPAAAAGIHLLFVQTGGATTLTPGTGDIHTLSITGVTAQTLHFSDRPYRIAGAIPTATFVGQWAAAFADSPPNATLIGHPEAGGETDEAVVVELLTPTYDAATATLTYQVRILDVEEIVNRVFEQEPLTVLDAPRQYAEAHLFIDAVDAGTYCRSGGDSPLCNRELICGDPNLAMTDAMIDYCFGADGVLLDEDEDGLLDGEEEVTEDDPDTA